MKLALAFWLLVLMGTFGVDLAFELNVPGYDESGTSAVLSIVNGLSMAVALMLSIAIIKTELDRDDR